jgi:uncharacterized protein (UPF0333 family)
MGSRGQVFLEYVLLLMLAIMVMRVVATQISDGAKEIFGNLAYVVSNELSTGSCEKDCFFSSYRNDKR